MERINKNRHKRIISLYKLHKNAAAVGRIMGLSRQWVTIILNKEGIATGKPVYKRCRMCDRPFGIKLRHITKGLCRGCISYINYHKKDKTRKYYSHAAHPEEQILKRRMRAKMKHVEETQIDTPAMTQR